VAESKTVRFAVAGLGWFAQDAILPAFRNAENAELVALFSGNENKRRELGRRHRVERLHAYDALERELERGGIDALYIALPNHLHREYTERAARAGVHVLCEKPMAVTADDCRAMNEATEKAGVKLMIAYRLHFEEANLEAMELVRTGRIGEPLLFNSVFGNLVTNPDDIRLNPVDQGGGPLYDVGVYCLNAARYIFRDEPVEVSAFTERRDEDERFGECEESAAVVLRFPGGRLASFIVSFGSVDHDSFHVLGTRGQLRVQPAFDFQGALEHEREIGDDTAHQRFEARDQVGPEIVYFADCILNDREPEPSGEEGLADVRVIRALHESARTGRSVRLEPFTRRRRPERSQEIRRPPVEKSGLVETKTRTD
jgi:glucose-fructose oxidoreductase